MYYASIIVTYNPNYNHLDKMVVELLEAGQIVVIYDNTIGKNNVGDYFSNRPNVYVLSNGINEGLGAAFNGAIKFLEVFENLPEAVLFFDQDSSVTSTNVTRLIEEYMYLKRNSVRLGVLGACPIDKDGVSYNVRKSKITVPERCVQNFYNVEFVISSFSIVPFEVFKTVGMFDENLFIDLVDSDFSFRCTSKGYFNLVSKVVFFEHVIGESRRSFLGRMYSISAPVRNYYQARNLILVGKKNCWFVFVIKTILRRFVQVCLSGLYERNLKLRMAYYFKGVYHGLIGRSGPI